MSHPRFIKDPRFAGNLQRLRHPNNSTNWLYIARAWAVVAATLAGAISFFVWRSGAGLTWLLDIPVAAVAIGIIGACQHQLAGLGHEGSHYALFRHRVLNDVISDVICMFPIFTTTNAYREQHLSHHKYVNDPIRDPDEHQLHTSGHKYDFPKTRRELFRLSLKMLLPSKQIRYTLGRMRAAATKQDYRGTHDEHGERQQVGRLPMQIGLLSLAIQIALVTTFVMRANATLLAIVPLALMAANVTLVACLPGRLFRGGAFYSAIRAPWSIAMRQAFLHSMVIGLGCGAHLYGGRVVGWFFLLWAAPLFTSFSMFMMMRQLVQHANADRGWLTNTRNFFVNPLARFAVFPIGQDVHLVHHMFASVPHYNLNELHDVMMEYPEYAEQTVEVQGYIHPPAAHPAGPTVVDVLSTPPTLSTDNTPFIDYSVDEAGRKAA